MPNDLETNLITSDSGNSLFFLVFSQRVVFLLFELERSPHPKLKTTKKNLVNPSYQDET